uniref:Uncharacterized protein n=1 Tax=Trichobilharzia regenti TaxID=157069 RepID=A0AA85JK71_TRIRE|nr:unnamed protein product [Trichobilharzia regenti]
MNMYQLVQTAPSDIYVRGVKFSKPCPEENYRYHNATGYFLCVVETAKTCRDLCQQLGCNDRYFMGVIPSKSDKIKRNYRCRCFPEYHVCFYNPLPKRIHDID